MPFVSQMLGLVPEAESLAQSALEFRLCCSVSEKEGRHLGGWAVSKGWGWGVGSGQTDLENHNCVKQMTNMY